MSTEVDNTYEIWAKAQEGLIPNPDGSDSYVMAVTNQGAPAQLATDINMVATTGPSAAIGPVVGGSYIFAIQAAAWNGAAIKLQCLGPDGATYMDVTGTSMTANGQEGIVVGANATLRLMATGGNPTGVYGSIS
jgi:hypothetical protein